MSATRIEHPSIDDRRIKGKQALERTAVSAPAGWLPADDRPDPVALLAEQDATREPDLVPVRHGRMLVSPFTFYRGAAKIMAADLKDTPMAGLEVQLCGDAHLSNFGLFAVFSCFATPDTAAWIPVLSSSSSRWAYQMSIVPICAKPPIASR